MKLKNANQISFSQTKNEKFDLIIAASGYESRSCTLAENINVKAAKCTVIGFEERKEEKQRIENDKKFKKLGFKNYNAREGNHLDIIDLLNTIITPFILRNTLKVLIDYSCMSRVWYATIINYFIHKYSEINNLSITFSYTPSKFTIPQDPMPNKYMGPIPGIYRVSASNKPTALIIGLGYEKDRAFGLTQYLDPKITYAFYTDPALEKDYTETVVGNNQNLISTIGIGRAFKYPLSDLKVTDSILTSLCLSLRDNYKVVLAPQGPKPFGLLSLFLAIKFPEIDVWRVSAGDSGNIYDRKPLGVDPIICQVGFVKENISSSLEV